VATVKANKSATAIWNHFDPERVHWTGVPLRVLITNEYRLQDYQIAGASGMGRFRSMGRRGQSDAPSTPAEKIQMMRTLLADRFHLTFHILFSEETSPGAPRKCSSLRSSSRSNSRTADATTPVYVVAAGSHNECRSDENQSADQRQERTIRAEYRSSLV
jgi:hypothetical protein